MKTYRLKYIDPFWGGFVFALMQILLAGLSGDTDSLFDIFSKHSSSGVKFPLVVIAIFAIVFGILIATLINAFFLYIYNKIAQKKGGIKIRLEEIEQ